MKKLLLVVLLCFTFMVYGCTEKTPVEKVYYTVVFDSLGGTEVASVEVEEGTAVLQPDAPTYEGFIFRGWYKTVYTQEEELWDFENDIVNQNMTLYAGWTLDSTVVATEGLTYELEENGYVVTGLALDSVETSITIPAEFNDVTVVAIGEGAFSNTSITHVTIADSIIEIRAFAFSDCEQLRTVYIGEDSNLTTISNNAFANNLSLTSLYIPQTLTSLGESVFENCGSIERFIVSETNTEFASLGGHLVALDTNTLIRGSNNNIIPEGVEIVSADAFSNSKITEVSISKTVTTIETNAFSDCSLLEKIEVNEDNLTYSSVDGVLYNKEKTILIMVPIKIGETINLPTTLVEVPEYAFDGCLNLKEVNIPLGDLSNIKSFAFRNTTVLINYEGTIEEWELITKEDNWAEDNIEITYKEDSEKPSANKVLVVYFSRTGNTKEIAEIIARLTNADLVEIVPETAYVENYNELLTVARNELRENARPVISSETLSKIDIDSYKTVFVGYPIWHGYEPMIIRSFINSFSNLANKEVYPFSTSASSGGSSAYNSIRNLVDSTATAPSYLHFTSSQLNNPDERISNWMEEIGIMDNVEGRRVKLSFANQEAFIRLVDNSATRDLVDRLMIENISIEFRDFASSEKIGYPTPALDVSNTTGYDPTIGDVTIYVPWGNIAIFYVDSAGYSDSLVHLGVVEGNGIDLLRNQNGNFTVILSIE